MTREVYGERSLQDIDQRFGAGPDNSHFLHLNYRLWPSASPARPAAPYVRRHGLGTATVSTGPRREDDLDGPEQYHVVLLDNGRSAMLGTEFQDMLRCIRCSACMNHCPVYATVGGHAYGWVYPGPMGAVLTPSLIGVEEAGHLPNASTFCGKCESVCPMKIPLPKMMRHWRERDWDKGLNPPSYRAGLKFWAFFAKRPALYRFGAGLAARFLKGWSGGKGSFKSLPLAGGWTAGRDFPVPQGKSFQTLWAEKQRGH